MEDIAVAVRAAKGESLVVVIAPGRDSLALAQVRASVMPLAIACAPGLRINAVMPIAGAAAADIDAAVDFLDAALSTTGQIVDIRPD